MQSKIDVSKHDIVSCFKHHIRATFMQIYLVLNEIIKTCFVYKPAATDNSWFAHLFNSHDLKSRFLCLHL